MAGVLMDVHDRKRILHFTAFLWRWSSQPANKKAPCPHQVRSRKTQSVFCRPLQCPFPVEAASTSVVGCKETGHQQYIAELRKDCRRS